MKEKLCILFQFIIYRWFSVFKNESALCSHQGKLLKKQQNFVQQHCAFYRQHPNHPIVDKQSWMQNFNGINTVGLDATQAVAFAVSCEQTRNFGKKLQGVTVGLSSGTSGHRGVFLVSDEERALWAGMMLAKALPKRHVLGARIAFFMRSDSNLYETVKSRFIQFEFFDMHENMEHLLCKLQELQPTVLVAPPSCMLKIAQWNLAGQIKPIKVISIAEVLEGADAEMIQDAFGVHVVHQIYQCTEGFLGITCQHGTLHINEDIILLEKEWLDEQRFFPIITDLKRRAQPVVRYRLNDVLVAKKEPCKCGSVFFAVEKIEGRQDDIFQFSGKHGAVSVFPDFIRRCILLADDVGEYRVQQISTSEIWVLADGLTQNSKAQIVSQFAQLAQHHGFTAPSIVFKPYENDMRRKLRRVEKLC